MHAHVFPDRLAAAALGALSAAAAIPATYDGTLAGLRCIMRDAGVAKSVLLPVATKPSQVRSINDWAASVATPDVVPFGAIHPDLKDAEDELERVASLGLLGVKMHPEYQAFRPDEERLDSLFVAATRLGLIVYFHAGEDIGLKDIYSTPPAFARLLEKHPTLTVVLAHMGGWRQWDDVYRYLAGKDVFFDTSFTIPYLGLEPFARLVAAHGAERVLFGSDVPWAGLAEEIALLRETALPDAQLEAILWRNADRLLGEAALRRESRRR